MEMCRRNRAPHMIDLLGNNMTFFEEYRSIQFNLNFVQVVNDLNVKCNTLKNAFFRENWAIKGAVCAED